jgi:hypothetical protein
MRHLARAIKLISDKQISWEEWQKAERGPTDFPSWLNDVYDGLMVSQMASEMIYQQYAPSMRVKDFFGELSYALNDIIKAVFDEVGEGKEEEEGIYVAPKKEYIN